jgi:hypothetical protein
MPGELWDLLEYWLTLHAYWKQEHTEDARRAMQAAWHFNLACPGDEALGADQGRTRCTATVLSRDTRTGWDEEAAGELYYRGACLFCGWVSWRDHPMSERDENGAAEDAVDHAWPGWRELPVVPELPYAEGPAATSKAQATWLKKVQPLLPPGWLEAGGPIRTLRGKNGDRHVPARTPWGGYDMGEREAVELPGGQLAFAIDVEEVRRPRRVRRGGVRLVKVAGRGVVDVPTGDRL